MARPDLTKRDLAYRALRDAGDQGLFPGDLPPSFSAHVESLTAEGHRIEPVQRRDRHGVRIWGCRLVRDAWE